MKGYRKVPDTDSWPWAHVLSVDPETLDDFRPSHTFIKRRSRHLSQGSLKFSRAFIKLGSLIMENTHRE